MNECCDPFRRLRIVTFKRRFSSGGEEEIEAENNRVNKAQIEAATRLQVFLGCANFSPGKIDGRYNDFTWKALVLYRESLGEPTAAFAWRIGMWCDLPQKSKRAITSQFTELR